MKGKGRVQGKSAIGQGGGLGCIEVISDGEGQGLIDSPSYAYIIWTPFKPRYSQRDPSILSLSTLGPFHHHTYSESLHTPDLHISTYLLHSPSYPPAARVQGDFPDSQASTMETVGFIAMEANAGLRHSRACTYTTY